jgi:Ca-activated chloride channel family protein
VDASAQARRARTVQRIVRGTMVALCTLATLALGLLYPVLERGDAWSHATWSAFPSAGSAGVGAAAAQLGAGTYLLQVAWFTALVLLLALVPFVVWKMTLGADARVPRLSIPSVAQLDHGPRGWRTKIRDLPGILRGAALTLAILALARPQNILRGENAEEKGIDIVVALDLSGSMQAVMDAPVEGMARGRNNKRPTRVDVAKEVLIDFIARRKSDRIGVVVFGRSAFVLSPPTLDYGLLTKLVRGMDLGIIDGNGTAIGDALGTSVARLRRSTARSKAIILITDGDNKGGVISPEYAAHLAQVEAARVYTVQIGNGDEVEVETGVDLFGQPQYQKYIVPVNPELLKKIAGDTGGQSFVATDKRGLEQSMHDILDHLEKTSFVAQVSTVEDLFPFLLLPAVALVVLEALVRLLLVRRFP